MANTIKVTVVAKDGLLFIDCPAPAHMPCPGTEIDGRDYWFTANANQTGWSMIPGTTEPESPIVGFPTARAKWGGHEYYIIADTASPDIDVNQQVADACNDCCAATETEIEATPEDIIPVLLPMGGGQPTVDCVTGVCTYCYRTLLPADSTNSTFTISFNENGTVVTSTDLTDIAAALAYANANWGTKGTWSLSGNLLSVCGSTAPLGALSAKLAEQDYCVDLVNSPPTAFNQIKKNGFTTNVPAQDGTKTIAQLIPDLAAYFADGTLTDNGSGVLGYTGTGQPQDFLLDGVVVASWALC